MACYKNIDEALAGHAKTITAFDVRDLDLHELAANFRLFDRSFALMLIGYLIAGFIDESDLDALREKLLNVANLLK